MRQLLGPAREPNGHETQKTLGGAHVAAARHVHVAHPLASWTKPSAQAMLHLTCGHAMACVPCGQVLHVHVGHPFASGTKPLVQERLGQVDAAHIGQKGARHAHLPPASRTQVAGAAGAPVHGGGRYEGIVPHSACVHEAGAALHAHVGHPLASSTLPY